MTTAIMERLFEYNGSRVRTVVIEGEPWFVAKDVCEVLGYVNHRRAVEKLSKTMKDDVPICDAIGRVQNTKVISEAGLYKLIFRSDLPEAENFADWVAEEVLPAIRKTGSYSTQPKSQLEILNGMQEVMKAHTELLLQKEREDAERDLQLKELKNETKEIKEIMVPKAKRYDTFLNDEGLMSFNDVAKCIGKKGYGRNNLMSLLRSLGILTKSKSGRNLPYQKYLDNGYFEIIWKRTGFWDSNLGYYVERETPTTYVTAKGVEFIFRILEKEGLISA